MSGSNEATPGRGAAREEVDPARNSVDRNSPDRSELYRRIEPRLRAIKNWMDSVPSPADGSQKDFFQGNTRGPSLSKEDMMILMRDLKEEGNETFKDKNYKHAGEFYTHSLITAKLLQVHHFVDIEPEFLSSLFSNRATCCFKMDMFREAIEDSDYAISLNTNNIKACYRKAACHKALREYPEALTVAEVALSKARQMGKTPEMKEIQDLINEIRSHMSPPISEFNPFEDKRKKNSTTSTRTVVSAAAPKAKVKTGVDESWLAGTAALPAQPKNSGAKPKKNKKKQEEKRDQKTRKTTASENRKQKTDTQAPPVKTAYKGRYSVIDKDDSSDSVEQSSSDGSDDISEPEDSGISESWASQVPDVPYEAMGLDDFSSKGAAAKSKPVTSYQRNAPPDMFANQHQFQRPPNREMGTWQKVGSSGRQIGQPAAGQTKKVHLSDFPILVPPEQLAYPFDKTYCFTLVCERCFAKVAEGPNGYRIQPNLVHTCDSNVLLIKKRDKTVMPWIKIRPRQNKNFLGKFQLCKTYPEDRSCRVGENKCVFAHFQEEIHLWTLDREGHFDIEGFIRTQREYLKQGKMKKVLNGQVLEDSAPTSVNLPMPDLTKPPPLSSNWENTPAPPTKLAGTRAQYGKPYQTEYAGTQAPPMQQPHTQSLLDLQPQYVNSGPEAQEIDKQKFPLKDTHVFKLACTACLQPSKDAGVFFHISHPHECTQDILVVQTRNDRSGGGFVRVRERKNHRPFPGKYAMCRYNIAGIRHGDEELCSFAHNRPEQILWGLEKDGSFNIQEFVLQNREGGNQAKLFTVLELYRRHPGDFVMLCRECYYNRPTIISTQDERDHGSCSNASARHPWPKNKYLVFLMHDTENNQTIIRTIEERPFTHKTAFFLLCKNGQYCMKKAHGLRKCYFAHSPVERDVWLLERDTGLARDDILMQFYRYKEQADKAAHLPARVSTPSPGDSGRSTPVTSQGGAQAVLAAAPKPAVDRNKPPLQMVEVCQLCWRSGQRSVQDKKKEDRCTGRGMGHKWSIQKMCAVVTKNKQVKEIRKMPSGSNMARGLNFILCIQIQEKKKCQYGDRCTFAHNMEEMEIWNFMIRHKIKTYEEMVEISRNAQEEEKQGKTIEKGQVVVSAKPMPAGAYRATKPGAPSGLGLFAFNSIMFHCQYCSATCNSQKQWDEHCASIKHMFNVNSDKEHQWNYRQPPWGVSGGRYTLCDAHKRGGQCRYSSGTDMHNLCKFAHSQAELDEWKERWEWRQMKREIARKEKVFSYMEEMLEDFEQAESPITVLAEEADGGVVISGEESVVYKPDKNATFTWHFEVQTQKTLEKVALLLNKDRLHFSIKFPEDPKGAQIVPGDSLNPSETGATKHYQVQVDFRGGLFGSFSQWVVFDFGSRPATVRKLNVELGTHYVQEKVKTLREKLNFDRWTGENREIVRFELARRAEGDLDSVLLRQYKPPSGADAVVTHEAVGVDLNRHNYVHKMHKLLLLEELSRTQIISGYNLKTEIELTNTIKEGAIVMARSGELFAKVPLNEELSEDTDAGKLILTSVQKVLLAPHHTESSVVYEAVILQKENFDYNGKGKDYIYLCLSPQCVCTLNLESGDSLPIEIQFQMDRRPFCQMHYAVDQLTNNDIVFPDVSRINLDWNEIQTLQIRSDTLNNEQMQIVRHVMADRQGYTPPLIIYGPFGTGKTETIAQASMLLLANKPTARILICTHSNSAADLYISKHLDSFITGNSFRNFKLLRVYFQERRKNTVSQTVQKYCIYKDDGYSFRNPTAEDLDQCNIVITTLSTSLTLTRLGVKGFFTHIFLDEAAQAMECETIMPLSMADNSTCVVMAGDHMQMGPKAYSAEAKKQKFDRSLLERLYYYYEAYGMMLDEARPLKLPLKLNYRSKMEILRFISAISYGGPNQLVAKSEQPEVAGIVPLTFYVAQGKEVQEADSTSYYNHAEVEEVADRVEELYDGWPEELWGERKGEYIAVVTPYFDQVNRIRQALRKRRQDLRSIVVERIMNMQGKEFRAVFISTVRTTHLAEKPSRQARHGVTECDGDVGDFGFLSDQKLLNTALTRAQSFVAVVGDPIALCALGDCVSVWRAYLKHCSQLYSIFPTDISFEAIRAQVVELMNSPLAPTIASINAVNQNRDEGYAPAAAGTAGASAAAPQPQQQQQGAPQFQYASILKGDEKKIAPVAPSRPMPSTSASGDLAREMGHLTLDELRSQTLSAADLLKQLALDSVTKQQLAAGKAASASSKVTKVKQIDLRWLEIKEEEGHAILSYDETPVTSDPYDSDDLDTSFGDDVDLGFVVNKSSIVEQSPSQLRNLLKSNPFKYKHCVLHAKSEYNVFAKVLDPSSPVSTVLIATKERRGRAIDGDEVVVEILHEKRLESKAKTGAEYTPQAQVLGVLKRTFNFNERLFVCTVNAENTGELIPINPGYPHIFNLETRARAQRARKGLVTVYKVNREREIVFHHHEPITAVDSKLFVVRCLRWDSKFHSPVGVVLDILPTGTNEENATTLLKTEYNLPAENFTPDVMRQLSQDFPDGYQIPSQSIQKRLDFRQNTTFTVEDDASGCMNFALSFDMVKAGQFLLGVHVADVSHFVKRGKLLDIEAYERGVEFVDADGHSVPLFPGRMRRQACELIPGADRLTLSLFFQIDSQANIIKMTPKKCVINSKKHLSLKEVQKYIDVPSTESDGIRISVLGLNKVASTWRSKRLGSDAKPPDPTLDPELFDAGVLVKEIQLTTNRYVAENLLQTYDQATPLLRQRTPGEQLLQKWREAFGEIAWNTVGLSRHFRNPGEVCTCVEMCHCITLPADASNLTPVIIEANSWSSVRNSLVNQCTVDINKMITDMESRPQVVLAWRNLGAILTHAQFVASGETVEEMAEKRHYSLNVNSLTHFTNPLTSYMDCVVHRLLIAVLKNQTCPYSQQDILALCSKTNDAVHRASEYKKSTRVLKLALNLNTQPLSFYPLIESIEASHVTLKFPKALQNIMASIQLSLQPVLYPGAVVERTKSDINIQLPVKVSSATGDEPTDGWWPKFHEIPSLHWQALLLAAKKKDTQAILDAAVIANEAVTEHTTSLAAITPDSVKMTLKPGHVTRVQLAAAVRNSILQPCIQLFSPVPCFDVCVEHRHDPLKCFLNMLPTESISRSTYPDIDSYELSWQQGLGIEVCETILDRVTPTVISGVAAMWYKVEGDIDTFTALIDLPLEYAVQNQFTFAVDSYTLQNLSMFADFASYQMDSEEERAFVCLRHPNIPIQPTDVPDLSRRGTFTWVAHCSLCKVTIQDNTVRLQLQLIQSAVKPPDSLIGQAVPATIEVIEKPEEIRVFQKTLLAMHKASPLCTDIVLGRPAKALDTAYVGLMEHLPQIPANQVHLDQMQEVALRHALVQPFTVVNGVAGSGKTTLVARLAYIFIQVNKRVYSAHLRINEYVAKQVAMICAPTQPALDIIERFLSAYGDIEILHSRDVIFPLDPSKFRTADVLLCTTAEGLHMRKLGDKYIQVVQIIIDNAQMGTEPDVIVPLAYFAPYQVILFGDEHQCKPEVVSERARKLGFAESLFHRNCQQAVRLTQHYRMHQGLAEFPAYSIYSTVMQAQRADQLKASMLKLWPQDRARPCVFMDLSDAIVDCGRDGPASEASKFNQEEINETCRMVTSLVRRHHANPHEVAVLSAFHGQCERLRETLNMKGEPHVTVSSVCGSAGKEWDYVIVSCVSSMLTQHIEGRPRGEWLERHLGAIADRCVVTTAITRARKGLIIVGNRRLLQLNDTWKRLLEFYDLHGKIVDARTYGK